MKVKQCSPLHWRFPSPSIRERKWPIVNENSAHHYTDSCIPAGVSIFPTPYKTANHKRVHAHVQAASWAMDAFGKIQIRIFEPENPKMDYQTKESALQVDSNS